MPKIPSVSFVGSGNVATHLAQTLFQKGVHIGEIYSQNPNNAAQLAGSVDARVMESLDFSNSKANIILICTPDQTISEISRLITLSDSMTLVHTSGTTGLYDLKPAPRTGVLYPVQTFSKSRPVALDDVPIWVEASDPAAEQAILQLASIISSKVALMNSEDRRRLHLAAVFASNFVNNLLTISEIALSQINLDLETLKPLVLETVHKAYALGPRDSQTGPALRNDQKVMDAHEKLIRDYLPEAWGLYQEHSRIIAQLKS